MPARQPTANTTIPITKPISATADRGEGKIHRQHARAKMHDGLRGRNVGKDNPAAVREKIHDGISGRERPFGAVSGVSGENLHDGVLQIVWREIDGLKAYGRNSRTHTKKQVGRIEGSLERFGWTTPLGIAGDVILAGHARQLAALNIRSRNGTIPRCPSLDLAPTVDLSALSPAERKAYVIADNKLAEEAGWDNKLLRLELSDLREMKFDLGLTGFSMPQIDVLLGRSEASGGRRITDGMRYQVVIDCSGEAEQATLLEEMRSRGLKAVPIIL